MARPPSTSCFDDCPCSLRRKAPAGGAALAQIDLLDRKQEAIDGRRFDEQNFYRETNLFDRFLSFDVKNEASASLRN